MKKPRKFASAEAAKRHRELEASWAAIKATKPTNFADKSRAAVKTKPKPIMPVSPLVALRLNEARQGRSLQVSVEHSHEANEKLRPDLVYSEEMLAREMAAREHTKTLKARVAPAYNKGGNVYLTEDEMAAMKRGELRRR